MGGNRLAIYYFTELEVTILIMIPVIIAMFTVIGGMMLVGSPAWAVFKAKWFKKTLLPMFCEDGKWRFLTGAYRGGLIKTKRGLHYTTPQGMGILEGGVSFGPFLEMQGIPVPPFFAYAEGVFKKVGIQSVFEAELLQIYLFLENKEDMAEVLTNKDRELFPGKKVESYKKDIMQRHGFTDPDQIVQYLEELAVKIPLIDAWIDGSSDTPGPEFQGAGFLPKSKDTTKKALKKIKENTKNFPLVYWTKKDGLTANLNGIPIKYADLKGWSMVSARGDSLNMATETRAQELAMDQNNVGKYVGYASVIIALAVVLAVILLFGPGVANWLAGGGTVIGG